MQGLALQLEVCLFELVCLARQCLGFAGINAASDSAVRLGSI